MVRFKTRLRASAATLSLCFLATGAFAQSSAPPADVPHFMIRAFAVKGNHILPPGEVEDAVYPFTGPGKTPDDVEHARAALQAIYEKKGYATVSVVIPEQGIDTGVIQLQVQPQSIGKLTVSGATRTSDDWVRDRAPSLKEGNVPNFKDVQNDIVVLNQSADRRITPEVKAGVAPGTVDVNLAVEDQFPLHGTLELNNDSSPETSELRLSGTLRYDDLWGRGDSISLSAQTAPQRSDDATVYSGNYLTHFGKLQGLFYYVHSDSDISVIGGTTVVGKGDMAGARLILPLSQEEGFYQSLTVGIDYKNFGEDVALGADRSSAPIEYFPLNLGWRGDWTTDRWKSDLSLSTTFNIRGLGDGLPAFDFKRYQAKPDFFLIHLDGSITQELPWLGLQAYQHVSGQWSGAPLISNEQFSIGGTDTVRGYFESEALGDYGVAIQNELRTPNFAHYLGPQVNELRGHVFFDSGYAAIHDTLMGQQQGSTLGSVGVGGSLKLFNHVNGAVDVGTPLKSGPDTSTGSVFARFRIWGEF
ncbi:MAG TPA: ShlB/FhaC/HecB family hemolysin secretion/activation protein [Rhizomicrobium sp.]|jgi:hemolysin activation/secretion protein